MLGCKLTAAQTKIEINESLRRCVLIKKIECTWIVKLLSLVVIGLLFSAGHSAAGQDQPTTAKDSVQVTAFTFDVYHKNYDIWSWVPRMQYRVNGPIASGSQLYVEFTLPTGPWVKFDCHTGEVQKGRWWKTECGGRDIPEDKSATYTGPVSFTIHLRNELAGNDLALFTGKMKVAKAHPMNPVPRS